MDAMIAQILGVGRQQQHLSELPVLTCPFCRSPVPRNNAELYTVQLRLAKEGKSWAQFQLGERFLGQWVNHNEDDVEAEHQAIHWLTLAAENGEIGAQGGLGRLWFAGTASSMPQSNAKALELLLPLARSGVASAQCSLAKICWDQDQDADALIWCTLSAAQGDPVAHEDLGSYFFTAAGNSSRGPVERGSARDEALFKTLYWNRKAAMRGRIAAQLNVGAVLLQIKESIFDGELCLVGYSCVPEINFWNRQANRESKGTNPEIPMINDDVALIQCTCCARPGRNPFNSAANNSGDRGELQHKIHRCNQCRSVGYCSRECQRKHWRMGHKVDCQHVAELEAAMKAAMAEAGPDPP